MECVLADTRVHVPFPARTDRTTQRRADFSDKDRGCLLWSAAPFLLHALLLWNAFPSVLLVIWALKVFSKVRKGRRRRLALRRGPSVCFPNGIWGHSEWYWKAFLTLHGDVWHVQEHRKHWYLQPPNLCLHPYHSPSLCCENGHSNGSPVIRHFSALSSG